MRAVLPSIMTRPAEALPKVLLGAAFVVAGVFGSALQADAAIKTKMFKGIRADGDLLDLLIYYDDSTQYTLPTLPPSVGLPGPFTDRIASPLSPLPGYAAGFKGYAITGVTGSYTENGNKYNIKSICPLTVPPPINHPNRVISFAGCSAPPYGGTPADSTNGLFSTGSYEEGVVGLSPPAELIPHFLSDNLFNPNLPDNATGGAFSGGGIVFNTEDDEYVYQLFTNPATGEFAGCGSGTCLKVNTSVPGPLPLLGVGAAFSYSRTLRKRIKPSQMPGVISTID